MSPGKLDPQVIRRHLMALRRTVAVLGRHRGCTVENLESDPDLRWSIERGLQLCAQNAIDLATHIAVASGLDVPDYATAIDALSDLDVLPRDFARRFRGVAGLRNVLVHGYLEVDTNVVVALLNERLGDFLEFADRVEEFTERYAGRPE